MGRILVLGERGNAIIPELAPKPGEPVIEKPGKGAFYNTNLEFLLKTSNISH
jgi:nicotinamidase-related amidase